jgi:outer membrane protein assembly factor BamB
MRIPVLLLATLSLTPAAAAGDDWPQFRGPHGDGHADATKAPLTWSETENVVWKTPIHDMGWSSPVVWGDQVWLTTATAKGTQMFAVCVDRATGKVVHDVKVFDVARPDPLNNPTNTYASPTPAVEEGRVYVHFGSYGTACLDTKTAKVLWARRDLPCNHWRGPASSPILYRDLLILTFDGYDLQYLAALDKTTGKTVWKTDRNFDYSSVRDDGDRKKAYSTPAVFIVNGKPQLVSPSAVATAAYDPLTGAELWRVYHGGMNTGVTPLYGHGKVFVCTSDGGLQLVAVRPDGSGDVTRTHIDWTFGKNVPNRSSPLLVDDLLYTGDGKGVLSCVEAKRGQPVWQQRAGSAGFWASPVYAAGRLYFCNDSGTTYVIEPGRSFKKLAENRLDDGCMASPAVAGQSLFLRTRTHLYRIEEKK